MADRTPSTRAHAEAADWLARFGNRSVTTQELRDFRDWRDDPANDAAYEDAETFWETSRRQANDPEQFYRVSAERLGDPDELNDVEPALRPLN